MKSGIYYICCLETGKHYVGSSCDINRRIKTHLNLLGKGSHFNVVLQRSWDKYGKEVFETGVLELVNDIETIIEREQFWISYLGEMNLAPVAGTTRGVRMTEENKRKMSARMLGPDNPTRGKKRPELMAKLKVINTGKKLTEEHKAKCSKSLKGKSYGPMLEETKLKLSLAKKGRKLTEEHCKKLSEIRTGKKPTAETLEKMRIAMTGKTHSDETKEKIRQLKVGKKLNLSDEERNRRARQAVINSAGRPISEKVREAFNHKGKTLSEEHRAKLSAATRGRPFTEEHRENLARANRERAAKNRAEKFGQK